MHWPRYDDLAVPPAPPPLQAGEVSADVVVTVLAVDFAYPDADPIVLACVGPVVEIVKR